MWSKIFDNIEEIKEHFKLTETELKQLCVDDDIRVFDNVRAFSIWFLESIPLHQDVKFYVDNGVIHGTFKVEGNYKVLKSGAVVFIYN